MKGIVCSLFAVLLLLGAVTVKPQRHSTLEGTVTRADTQEPLADALVAVSLPDFVIDGFTNGDPLSEKPWFMTDRMNRVATAKTDINGRFTLNGITPGSYLISAQRTGFVKSEYGARQPGGKGVATALKPDQRLTVQLQMLPASTISGRVIKASGEPLAGRTVRAYRYEYSNGQRRLGEVARGETNDLGEYRILSLESGDYFLSTTLDQTSRDEVNPSAPVYYPDTLNPKDAVPIRVPASVELREINFSLRDQTSVTLRGQVFAPSSLTQRASAAVLPARVHLYRVGQPRVASTGLSDVRRGTAAIRADGSFEFRGVASGDYIVMAFVIGANGTTYTARHRQVVNNEDISAIVLNLKPGVEVRGSIRIEGAPREPLNMTDLSITLVAEDSAFTSAGNPVARVEEGGAFTLHDVAATEYRVRVLDLPRGVYVESGKLDWNDVLSGPVAIGEREAVLQLRLASSVGHVVGNVVDEMRVAAAGVTVVLVPEGSRRGYDNAYVVTTADASGKYKLSDVPPGRYKAFAWESVPSGAWQYPDFIQRYEERGQRVTVDAVGEASIVLRLIAD